MNDLPNTSRTLSHLQQGKRVTSRLFEAYLACPTKCFLRSIGEVGTGNDFTIWNEARHESYRREGIKRLMHARPGEFKVVLPKINRFKKEAWHFAIDQVASAHDLEADVHLVQRIPLEGANKSFEFVSIRFVPANKLSRFDKLMSGFDAHVLSKAWGAKGSSARIIHGDQWSTFTLNPNSFSREVNKIIGKIAALLSAPSPPDLILNKHCSECEFRDRCRAKAIEKNDLSLLSGLTDKERIRLNGKGLFTVTQLSYTFRPRRRAKRLAAKPERYHHSLKALSLREQKIHIVGNPQFRVAGTPVYFDVEALPDRDFYYLIGTYLRTDEGMKRHSLWADTAADENRIWDSFLNILSGIDRPVLIHYGSFETTFLKKMCERYGTPPEGSAAAQALASSINLLSAIYAQVYFPAYSNGLKEIARYLGFEWTSPSLSGIQSIAWRYRWEESFDPMIRAKLIAYNAEDCEALSLVADTLSQISQWDITAPKSTGPMLGIVHAESLERKPNSKWRSFKSPLPELEQVNVAAHWDYQRDRVFVRSGVGKKRKPTTRSTSRGSVKTAAKVVVFKPSPSCPQCGKRSPRKFRLLSRTVQDLIFGRDSLKRRVVAYVFQTYRCRSCKHEYGLNEWYRGRARKWGWNMLAYFIYHIVGLRVPQLTMQHSLNRLFGFKLVRSTLNNLKMNASEYYLVSKRRILRRIIQGDLIHVDETRANIKGSTAYVWVLTNLKEVVYILAESREGDMVQELLKDFKGVLVSDFYAAYDSIACDQQKCLIHLIRDLNDEILNNPFDEELKSIVVRFASLLKVIVETIDRRGLKKYFLRKHQVKVDQFYRFLNELDFKSEAASKCKERFEKNRGKLFTFLCHDGVPWNNNNAEHAIKAFARLRDVLSGLATKKSLDEYLTLLSVAQTCEYQGLDFLDFLRSEEKDVATFAEGRRRHRSNTGNRSVPTAEALNVGRG
jgi:predicted RecB family nuclease